MGPHPAVAEVRHAVRSLLILLRRPSPDAPGAARSPVDRVLVACSGGADSLALAAATAFVAPRLGIAAGLITVDHGLQEGSAAQAERVATIGFELGFDPVETVRVDVGTAGGPEAAAREARYAALAGVAEALDAPVLLGHTLDDQAETVLLGLGRGSGPRSIAGMRPVDGRYLRPLLGVRRATTVVACVALGLQPWDDPHNADPSFQRVRLRREVLPLLDDVLQGGVAEALARTAALVRDDLDALDRLALSVIKREQRSPGQPVRPLDHREGAALDVAALAPHPRAIRTRVLRAWATAAGAAPLSAAQTAALDALVADWHGQGAVDLPGGVRAVRASGKLNAIPPHPPAQRGQA